MKYYLINEFISLRLEDDETVIYVKDEKFIQCKNLVVKINTSNVAFYDSIESMENGGTLSVTVSHDMELQRLKIEIEDNGKGIDQKDLANVFDPYFTTRQSGTGLGLAIVHRIIESHNGEVRIESEPGKGTSVIIYLPVD